MTVGDSLQRRSTLGSADYQQGWFVSLYEGNVGVAAAGTDAAPVYDTVIHGASTKSNAALYETATDETLTAQPEYDIPVEATAQAQEYEVPVQATTQPLYDTLEHATVQPQEYDIPAEATAQPVYETTAEAMAQPQEYDIPMQAAQAQEYEVPMQATAQPQEYDIPMQAMAQLQDYEIPMQAAQAQEYEVPMQATAQVVYDTPAYATAQNLRWATGAYESGAEMATHWDSSVYNTNA
jgi:hypothetical protein